MSGPKHALRTRCSLDSSHYGIIGKAAITIVMSAHAPTMFGAIATEVERGLEKLAARHIIADFVFLDPPYDDADAYWNTLEYLDTSHLVAPRGIVIAEHSSRLDLPERLDRLERTRLLEQGDAALSFYALAAAA